MQLALALYFHLNMCVGHFGNAFASVGIAGFDRRVDIAAMTAPFRCMQMKIDFFLKK